MKKIVVKILLNVLLIVSISFALYQGITTLQTVQTFPDGATITRGAFRREAICFFISAIMQIIFLVFLDFLEIKFFKTSAFKQYSENKEACKQKKIETLEKQLNELKKDE